MSEAPITVDTSALEAPERALSRTVAALGDQGNPRMQAAARGAASGLLAALRASAAGSPTPQARIVAEAMQVTPGPGGATVTIGGGRGVGLRGTPAGELVYGSERGGVNFQAPRGGSYWIAPAVDRYSAGGAERVYTDAVNGILHDAGLG